MATKRTPTGRDAKIQITPEMVRLFKLCHQIEASGLSDVDEDDGGRRLEHGAAVMSFHVAINYRPYQISPLWVKDMLPPEDDEWWTEDYKKALAIRRRLEEAAA